MPFRIRNLPGNKMGFTGTRRGMTEEQRKIVASIVAMSALLQHGDCIGADEQAHYEALAAGIPITVHPPEDPKYRAFCSGPNVTVLEERPYKDRNCNIVDASNFMVATPRTMSEELRSGTWHAIRYTSRTLRPLLIIWPDGSVSTERWNENA